MSDKDAIATNFCFSHAETKDLLMLKQRQYRGGYQMAGLLALARELRKRATSAEALLWQLLRDRRLLGFKFRRQHQFGDFVMDFYCREAGLAIECDGSVHERNEQWQHDQKRDVYMIGQGLRVLRIPNERILNDTASVLEEIAQCLPSPFGRGAGGEGLATTSRPSPRPSPRGRGR
jgi:very-short-patch-repair endonuclease